MTHLYIAGIIIGIVFALIIFGKAWGSRREKQKQQEWENKYLREQQVESNKTGIRNAEIDKESISTLDDRLNKWVRD